MSFWVLQKTTLKVNFVVGGGLMKLREYLNLLDAEALAAYAGRCQIAISYLRVHIKYASKDPSLSLIRALARESEGNVSLIEVLVHFGVIEAGSLSNRN